ncbi:MAG: hypothetical protein J0I25_02095 [Sphingomonadales bacterium]|nr:hypothetical protein [Sphingomonadales bacterium]
MNRKRIVLLSFIVTAGIATTACANRSGYGGASLGYGTGYYGGYSPYWGWYGDYYYPGTGIYVYDRHRRAHPWSDDQRHYWQGRVDAYRAHPDGARHARPHNPRSNWHDFGNRAHAGRPNAGHSPAARPHVSNPNRGHAPGGRHGGGHRGGGHSGGGHAGGGPDGHNPHQ